MRTVICSLNSTRGVPYRFKPPGRLIDFMREAGTPRLINLAAGVPSPKLLPVTGLKSAFEQALSRDGGAIFAYHLPEGDVELREIIASRLAKRGVDVTGGHVVTTTGCTQGLEVALSVMGRPGDVVACECPVYYGLLELLSRFGFRVVPLRTDVNRGIDLETLRDAVQRHKPRLIVVCSSLSNPSSATLPEADRKEFVGICRKGGTRIIEDEVYAELCEGPLPPPLRSFDDGSTVVYVSSFSKSIAPGLRAGIAVPGKWFEAFAERKCQQDMHSCVVSEVMLREYFRSGEAERELKRMRRTFAKRRKIARDAIARTFPEGTVVSAPRGGFMYWAILPWPVDLRRVQRELMEERIAFAHGQVFFPRREEERYMRLNCAKASERELKVGLERLGTAIGKRPSG